MKPHISLKKAIDLAVFKWQKIVENNGDSYDNYLSIFDGTKIASINNECGFCHRWQSDSLKYSDKYETNCACNQCEFAEAMGTFCNDDDNPKKNIYQQWAECFPSKGIRAKHLAQKILKLIQSIPITE